MIYYSYGIIKYLIWFVFNKKLTRPTTLLKAIITMLYMNSLKPTFCEKNIKTIGLKPGFPYLWNLKILQYTYT